MGLLVVMRLAIQAIARLLGSVWQVNPIVRSIVQGFGALDKLVQCLAIVYNPYVVGNAYSVLDPSC